MEFYENYYQTGRCIHSKAGQDEFYGAMVRYLYEGVEPESFKSQEAAIAFQAVRPSRIKQWKGRQNKLGLKRPSKREGTPKETGSKSEENDKQDESNAEGNENKLRNYQTKKLSSIDRGNPEFAWACLDAFNRVLGTTYSTIPEKCIHTLERLSDAYTVDDVEAMIRYKRDEWSGTRFSKALTPNTLFSPDHFEQYMNQSKADTKERDEYAAYN